MTDPNKLYAGVSKAAWAYFFLYFNININTVSILPSFIGFLLFLSAIDHLKEEERELELLRPLGIFLLLWHIAGWLVSWFGLSLDGQIAVLDIVVSIADLYFHFQLLTNLASLAAKYQPQDAGLDRKLLLYRTLQTLLLTAFMVLDQLSPWLTDIWVYISVGMLLVYLFAAVCLMKALFDLRNYLKT